jgi:hypothetical protein
MKSTTKVSKPKQFNIFDFLKAIIDTKPNWETFSPEEQKVFNGFMTHKFLSMNPKYIEIVNYVQGLNLKDSKKIYDVYKSFIPQSKNTYSPYIKSTKSKVPTEVLPYIAEYFECSTYEASDYVELTDKEWIENILVQKGVDEKTIKKLKL